MPKNGWVIPTNELVAELGAPTPSSGELDSAFETRANAVTPDANASSVVTFEGYLGGSAGGDRAEWAVLYLDIQLERWLVVEKGSIHRWEQVQDRDWDGRSRDIIWVYKDAVVGTGRGPVTTETRFLIGEFTRAGDVDAAPAGGALPASSDGVFCPRSPNCCPYHSRTPPAGCR